MRDLISRQDAIEVLRNRWLKTRNYDGIGEDIAEECEIYLKTLPPAQPERPNGEWILSGENTYTCSVCGKTIITNKDYIKEHKWCFGCGTKMGKRKGADE